MGEEKQWYIVHTYSGQEKKVQENLEKRITSTGMEDKIIQVEVPTEEKIKKKDGEEEVVDETLFPGYVLIEMEMNDDTWYVVRNTPGVAGFVSSGTKPLPAQPEEIDRILGESGKEKERVYDIEFEEGDKVSVIDGPFEDFVGIVQEVHPRQGKVKVMVSMFGRDTPVELDFAQVESE